MNISPESLALLRARLLKLKTALEGLAADPAALDLVPVIRLHVSAAMEWRSAHYPNEYAEYISGIAQFIDSYDLRVSLSNLSATNSDYDRERAASVIRSAIQSVSVLLADIGDAPEVVKPLVRVAEFASENKWFTSEHREVARVLSRGAAKVNDVAKAISLSRDKARGLLSELAAHGYAERDNDRSPYRLTTKASALPGVKSA